MTRWPLASIIIAWLLAVDLSCAKPCKQGTLRLVIDLVGPALLADELVFTVAIEGRSGMPQSRPHSRGQTPVSVEVAFPRGYPAGKTVSVTVEARGDEQSLHATQQLTAHGDCWAGTLTLGEPSDANSDERLDIAPASDGHLDGPDGELADRDVVQPDTAAQGVDARDPDRFDALSQEDRSNDACVATAEDCFNGADDDCDGMADCSDLDCQPTATCVSPPAPDTMPGIVLTDSSPCPPGFGAPIDLHRGLRNDTSCWGCGCRDGVTQCVLDYTAYKDSYACSADSGTDVSYKGSLGIQSGGAIGPCRPAGNGSSTGSWRFSGTLTMNAACEAFGTPTPAPPSWAESVRFCPLSTVAGGCPGAICAPKPTSTISCVRTRAGASCPSGFEQGKGGSWYLGLHDERVCGACTCEAIEGSCANVKLYRATTCSVFEPATVPFGHGDCGSEFSYLLMGEPTAPACGQTQPKSSGLLQGAGDLQLCCKVANLPCVTDGGCQLPNGALCTQDAECASGQCGTLYLDNDRDGYGAVTTWKRACVESPTSGLPGWSRLSSDCCDTDSKAHPQPINTYNDKPNGCGSFDYDCDGKVTKNGAEGVIECVTSCAGTCERGCSPALRSNPYGWVGTAPECGQEGMRGQCQSAPSTASGCNDQGSCFSSLPQETCSLRVLGMSRQTCH